MSADRTSRWLDAWLRCWPAECHSNHHNRACGCHDTGRATRTRLTHKQWPQGARATRARDARASPSRMHLWVFAGAASNGTIRFLIRRRHPLQLCGLAKKSNKKDKEVEVTELRTPAIHVGAIAVTARKNITRTCPGTNLVSHCINTPMPTCKFYLLN